MAITLKSTEQDLASELTNRGLSLNSKALEPLARIDFRKLKDIYDHEEFFLRKTLVGSLVDARHARLQADSSGDQDITRRDVEVAMLMMGSAVRAAAEQTFSKAHAQIIRDVCPFCTD